ncbi:MAG: hypothetical protein JWP08_2165, partial [Bryobacterales bacterium]|nr:hypothetical protein [Bryobacterales bacterium]
ETGLAIGKSAVAAWLSGGGTGKELIPRRETGADGINYQDKFAIELRGELAIGVAQHRLVKGDVGRQRSLLHEIPIAAELIHCRPQKFGIVPFGAIRGCADEIGSDEVVYRRIAIGRDSLQQIFSPGFKVIHPGDDGVNVAPEFGGSELSEPAIVTDQLERRLDPVLRLFETVKKGRCNRIVTVREDIGFDADQVTYGSFCREPAAIDLRANAFDDDPLAAVVFR